MYREKKGKCNRMLIFGKSRWMKSTWVFIVLFFPLFYRFEMFQKKVGGEIKVIVYHLRTLDRQWYLLDIKPDTEVNYTLLFVFLWVTSFPNGCILPIIIILYRHLTLNHSDRLHYLQDWNMLSRKFLNLWYRRLLFAKIVDEVLAGWSDGSFIS